MPNILRKIVPIVAALLIVVFALMLLVAFSGCNSSKKSQETVKISIDSNYVDSSVIVSQHTVDSLNRTEETGSTVIIDDSDLSRSLSIAFDNQVRQAMSEDVPVDTMPVILDFTSQGAKVHAPGRRIKSIEIKTTDKTTHIDSSGNTLVRNIESHTADSTAMSYKLQVQEQIRLQAAEMQKKTIRVSWLICGGIVVAALVFGFVVYRKFMIV